MINLHLKRRVENLERGFNVLANQKMGEKIQFTTYSENGKKYLVLFGVECGVSWSKHFIVDEIADDRGINTEHIHNETLFRELKAL